MFPWHIIFFSVCHRENADPSIRAPSSSGRANIIHCPFRELHHIYSEARALPSTLE